MNNRIRKWQKKSCIYLCSLLLICFFRNRHISPRTLAFTLTSFLFFMSIRYSRHQCRNTQRIKLLNRLWRQYRFPKQVFFFFGSYLLTQPQDSTFAQFWGLRRQSKYRFRLFLFFLLLSCSQGPSSMCEALGASFACERRAVAHGDGLFSPLPWWALINVTAVSRNANSWRCGCVGMRVCRRGH